MKWLKIFKMAKDIDINEGIKDTGKIADNLFTSKEERLSKENQDRADAREMNENINNSEKASWLSKNIAPIMAIFGMIISSYIVYALINKPIPEKNEDILYFIAGSIVTGTLIQTYNFYFGTSSSSSSKDKIFKNILKRK